MITINAAEPASGKSLATTKLIRMLNDIEDFLATSSQSSAIAYSPNIELIMKMLPLVNNLLSKY